MAEILIIILITVLGLIFGSFFACSGYRIPNKVKLTEPRSFCPKCKKVLKWYMNIPVLSFIFLKGRCSYCKEPINFIYPFVEITTAALFLCNYIMFDFTVNFWIATIITSALMVTIVSDFIYYYISDRVLLLSLLSLIITLLVFTDYKIVIEHIISGALLFLMMLGIKYIGNYIFKKESLGDGDIKLLGVIGLALGAIYGLVSLFIGSLLGLIFALIFFKKNKDGIIPFGPFLLMGALISIYFEQYIQYFIDLLII